MNKKRLRLVLIVIFFIFSGFESLGFGRIYFDTITTMPRDTLKEFNGISVVVTQIEPEIEKDGLTQDRIKTDIEENLRGAGIKVLSREAWQKEKGKPFIYVEPLIFKRKPKFGEGVEYFGVIKVEFRQLASLVKSPGIKVFAPTWERSSITITKNLISVQEDINNKIDIFINSYKY